MGLCGSSPEVAKPSSPTSSIKNELASDNEIVTQSKLPCKKKACETKEPTTTTATLEDGGDGEGEGGLVINTTPSLASRLNKRADVLRCILSFHETRNLKHYYNLRSFSKLFHRALPQPPPLWTSYPNSNHATLQSLVNRLEELRGDEESSGNVPSVLFIEEGEHREGGNVTIKKPLSMYGAGRGMTTLVGVGLMIEGNKSDGIVEIENLKIKGAEGNGLYAGDGMNVIMRGCTVEDCKSYGVAAYEADISCDDLQVVGCGGSGVVAFNNATITLSGQGTTIQRNGTKGYSYYYGLNTSSSSSFINLIHPLTKEQISTNNGSGGNWGGYVHNIKQVQVSRREKREEREKGASRSKNETTTPSKREEEKK